ncbi:hypothetical protein JJB98_28005 [Bradyrhizobium diazoefficiens]|nr:hypothetical protein [Bradyrhizobium diazoefficiens]QQO23503.1 hypothetical protein JJB98_28005 [Bradyrhizobium diazoefficiens]
MGHRPRPARPDSAVACPINTSGGLISKGHPVGATGIIQLHELVLQLRGEAGQRQVSGARIALAENRGGFWESRRPRRPCPCSKNPRPDGMWAHELILLRCSLVEIR